MKTRTKQFLLLLLLYFGALVVPAFAQEEPVLTFTAETTTGAGTVVPVLSWQTDPVATSCVASGHPSWAGEKGPQGTETLAPITESGTFILSCTWASDDDVDLNWINPTENTDGTPYTDPGHTLVEYSPDGQAPWFMQVVEDPSATSTIVSDLEPGDWTFRAYAVNLNDVSSDASALAVFVVDPPAEFQESTSITVNSKPAQITGLSAQ